MSLPSEQNWLVLHHLITDLNQKGYEIPKGINPEMGLIRSSISSYKRDPSHPDLINSLAKAEMSLNNIQGTLLTIAEEEGDEYTDHWLDLLKQAMKGEEDHGTINVRTGIQSQDSTGGIGRSKNPGSNRCGKPVEPQYGQELEE